MHLLCIFVFCFSCLDFFAFQFFLHWCVLISPLCLPVFAFGNTHTCALNYSEKDDKKFLRWNNFWEICTNISGIFLSVFEKFVVWKKLIDFNLWVNLFMIIYYLFTMSLFRKGMTQKTSPYHRNCFRNKTSLELNKGQC